MDEIKLDSYLDKKRTENNIRPISELVDTGILWAFNRNVMHPQGLAIGFVYTEDGALLGWELQGTGSEPWRFDEESDKQGFQKYTKFIIQTLIKANHLEDTFSGRE